jgi:hypothetical protein
VFSNPNNLAMFLVTVMVFCFFALISRLRSMRAALPLMGILLVTGYVLFLTFSRRAWLLLPVMTVVGVALQRGLSRRVSLLLMAGLVIGLFLYRYAVPVLERLSDLFQISYHNPRMTGGSLQMRLVGYQVLIRHLRTPVDWLFGLGAGTIGFAQRNYAPTGFPSVDSYYWVLIGEYGLAGLLLYLALILAVISKLARTILQRRLQRVQEEIVIASLVSGLVVLLAGIFGNSNTTFPTSLYLWVFLGIGLAVCVTDEEREAGAA